MSSFQRFYCRLLHTCTLIWCNFNQVYVPGAVAKETTGAPGCVLALCERSVAFRVNTASHISHWNGFSPVCRLIWRTRITFCPKILSQYGQGNICGASLLGRRPGLIRRTLMSVSTEMTNGCTCTFKLFNPDFSWWHNSSPHYIFSFVEFITCYNKNY